MRLIRKYWDIFGGFFTGISLSIIVKFELEKIQLIYSIIILILVSIGIFKVIKQAIGKSKKRKHNLVDDLVDSQRPIKAISIAQDPTHDGEEIGKIILKNIREGNSVMEKLKTFFDKFKGYILTIALGILTIIEMCGGFINDACKEFFTINGVEILPIITLVCSLIVGLISNGFTKEQREQIKAIVKIAKDPSDALVKEETNKAIKQFNNEIKDLERQIDAESKDVVLLEKELATAVNTYNAKVEMHKRFPDITSQSDVNVAEQKKNELDLEVLTRKNLIAEKETKITMLKTKIAALKTQL